MLFTRSDFEKAQAKADDKRADAAKKAGEYGLNSKEYRKARKEAVAAMQNLQLMHEAPSILAAILRRIKARDARFKAKTVKRSARKQPALAA